VSTPWRHGRIGSARRPPQLLFGSMYEDCALELELLPAGGRSFCIASAGCTALALAARGDAVTAVDINPAQVAYVRARLAGAPRADGVVDHQLARARRLGGLVGWSRSRREAFCDLDDPAQQARMWREQLDSARLRAATAVLLSVPVLRRTYAREFVSVVPNRFGGALRRRLERGFARHPNRQNPYARLLLLGNALQLAAADRHSVDVVCADAADHLERAARQSYDGFSLSNVLDGASAAYGSRLLRAVERAAAPGAVLILRSIAEPTRVEDARWAERDRSLIWGSVRVKRLDGN
jgi:S-adenosylmethionine:diacylglycerol 3-amino-3-carboxypropyl transferase